MYIDLHCVINIRMYIGLLCVINFISYVDLYCEFTYRLDAEQLFLCTLISSVSRGQNTIYTRFLDVLLIQSSHSTNAFTV